MSMAQQLPQTQSRNNNFVSKKNCTAKRFVFFSLSLSAFFLFSLCLSSRNHSHRVLDNGDEMCGAFLLRDDDTVVFVSTHACESFLCAHPKKQICRPVPDAPKMRLCLRRSEESLLLSRSRGSIRRHGERVVRNLPGGEENVR